MNCPFCAEEIKNAATLCRFCGAVKTAEGWIPPPPPAASPPKPKGRFTIQFAGAFFILSAVFEAFQMTSEVPLFGAMRGGITAGIYHFLFLAVYLAMGAGLLSRRYWGYLMVFVGTGLYTVERLIFLLDKKTQEVDMAAMMGGSGNWAELRNVLDVESLNQLFNLLRWVILACWWGFALYIHRRRAYFQSPAGRKE